MTHRRLVAIVATFVTLSIARPAPVQADAGTIAALAAGATAGYVALVLFFTQVVFRSDFAGNPAPGNARYEPVPQGPIKLTPHCPQGGELVTLACW